MYVAVNGNRDAADGGSDVGRDGVRNAAAEAAVGELEAELDFEELPD